jgi:hypothetical protein
MKNTLSRCTFGNKMEMKKYKGPKNLLNESVFSERSPKNIIGFLGIYMIVFIL